MIDKLVKKIINGVKKHECLRIPAIACIYILYLGSGAVEAVVAWRRDYGRQGDTLLLCLLLVVVIAVGGPWLPLPAKSIPVAIQPLDSVALPEESSEKEEPYDREHPEIPPEPAVDGENPEQTQLIARVENYVGKLKANQVTPNWKPDLVASNAGKNLSYYEVAWAAYQELTEANRGRIDGETLSYLLTCHQTVTKQ